MKMEKLHLTELAFLFLVTLGGSQFLFLLFFHTGSWWRVVFGGQCNKFHTIFQKYPLKISTSSLPSDATFLFSILSVFFEKLCNPHDILLKRCHPKQALKVSNFELSASTRICQNSQLASTFVNLRYDFFSVRKVMMIVFSCFVHIRWT